MHPTRLILAALTTGLLTLLFLPGCSSCGPCARLCDEDYRNAAYFPESFRREMQQRSAPTAQVATPPQGTEPSATPDAADGTGAPQPEAATEADRSEAEAGDLPPGGLPKAAPLNDGGDGL